MSEFWKYFRDTLAWPQIHTPGPLSAVVRGAALALDRVRDDIVYFRRQWFPALCEPELVADHGQSRGLVRHPKETPDQFRARVVNAYRWHLLGGKTEGLPEILKFYGVDALTIENLRRYQPSRWAEFQVGLKTPATQEAQEALLADLDALIWFVNEYKPARSVLARLYTDIYNRVPTVWSEGPAWSEGFWSCFSGVPYPDKDSGLPYPDKDSGLIVSFGMVYRAQSDRYNNTGVGIGIENISGICAPYIDSPMWSCSAWSDVFPKNHGFTIGELVSLHWCVRTTTSYAWLGGWDSRRWQEAATWDRVLPPWRFRWRSAAKVQAVFSWPGDGGEPGETFPAPAAQEGPHGEAATGTPPTLSTRYSACPPRSEGRDGTWGDINACYGLPTATVVENPPKWGDTWGHDPQRRSLTILERFQHKSGHTCAAVSPAVPQVAGACTLAIGTAPLRPRGWNGGWGSRRWWDYVGQINMRSEKA